MSRLKLFLPCLLALCFLFAPYFAQEEKKQQSVEESNIFGLLLLQDEDPATSEEFYMVRELCPSNIEEQNFLEAAKDKIAGKASKKRLLQIANKDMAGLADNLGKVVKIQGRVEGAEDAEVLKLYASRIEPLAMVIGSLTQAQKDANGDLTRLELKEVPQGALFKSDKTYTVANLHDFPKLTDSLDQKIAAFGFIISDEEGQASFQVWDVREILELKAILKEIPAAEVKQDAAEKRWELEDLATSKKYTVSYEEGLGKELSSDSPRKVFHLQGYLRPTESGEAFVVTYHEELKDAAPETYRKSEAEREEGKLEIPEVKKSETGEESFYGVILQDAEVDERFEFREALTAKAEALCAAGIKECRRFQISNGEAMEDDLENNLKRVVRLQGRIEGDANAKILQLSVTKVEPLAMVIGTLTNAQKDEAGKITQMELQELPKGKLLSSDKTYLVSNLPECPEMEKCLGEKIVAFGSILETEGAKASFKIWDIRPIIEFKAKLHLAPAEIKEARVARDPEIKVWELEDLATGKRYIADNDEGLSAELDSDSEKEFWHIQGYARHGAGGKECFHVTYHEYLEKQE